MNCSKATRVPTCIKREFCAWLCVVIALCVLAFVGPYIVTGDPLLVDLEHVRQPPSAEFLLGTDSVGRSVAIRLIVGARSSIFAALIIVTLSMMLGTLFGMLSGSIGGKFDALCMRIVDIFLAFPQLIFAIAIAGLLGAGLYNAILSLVIVGWTKYARIARSQTLSVKTMTFVKSARMAGLSHVIIAVKHIFPHIFQPLVIAACLDVGNMLLAISGLSFLGLGTALPYPEWGSMLNSAAKTFQLEPWGVFAPGCAILLVVMAFNMLGDSVNRFLDSAYMCNGVHSDEVHQKVNKKKKER